MGHLGEAVAAKQHIRMNVTGAEEIRDATSPHDVARWRRGRLRWA